MQLRNFNSNRITKKVTNVNGNKICVHDDSFNYTSYLMISYF